MALPASLPCVVTSFGFRTFRGPNTTFAAPLNTCSHRCCAVLAWTACITANGAPMLLSSGAAAALPCPLVNPPPMPAAS